jgi:hypothetical protein
VRRRAPCSGFVRGLQRTEAETKRGDIANTFQTRRVLVDKFGMMYLESVLRVVKEFRKRLAKRHFTHLPRPTLQPAHQDPQRSAQTQHAMRMGRDWPVRPVIRPEQCQALGKTLSLADLPVPIRSAPFLQSTRDGRLFHRGGYRRRQARPITLTF